MSLPDTPFSLAGLRNMVTVTGQSLGGGAAGQAPITTQPVTRALRFREVIRDTGSGVTAFEDLRFIVPLRETVGGGSPYFSETIASGFAAQVERTRTELHQLLVGNWSRGSAAYATLAQGTATYNRGLAQVRAGRRAFSDLIYRATLCVHGESDSTDANYGTNVRTWQANWQTDVNALVGQSRTVPFFHTQAAASAGANMTGPVAVLNEFKTNPTLTVLVGPKYHLEPGSDWLHLTCASYRILGEYYGKAYAQHVVGGSQWSPLYPTTISRSGAVVTVTFGTAVGNLVLDTTTVTNPGNYGFEWNDDSGKTISSVALVDSNKVVVTLNGTPTINANTKLRYGWTAPTTSVGGPLRGPRGNLRDSDPAVGVLSGQPLYNWCCHFNETVA